MITSVPASDSYNLTQKVVETGAISTQIVPCQSGKKYTVPYVVYEKVTACKNYPPEGKVTFYNIVGASAVTRVPSLRVDDRHLIFCLHYFNDCS